MGQALSIISITIPEMDAIQLGRQLLGVLSRDFLTPQSLRVVVPVVLDHKFPWSIDSGIADEVSSINLLPGERLTADGKFTCLDNEDHPWTATRAEEVLSKVQQAQIKAGDQMSEPYHEDAVYLTLWGEMKLACVSASGQLGERKVLRQTLSMPKVLEPTCEFHCVFVSRPASSLVVSMFIDSHVWSFYENRLSAGQWVRKSDLTAERKNAQTLAELLGSFVKATGSKSFDWTSEWDHTPDLRGFLSSEFERCLQQPASFSQPQ